MATRLRERVLRVRPRQAVPAYRRTAGSGSGSFVQAAGMLPVLIIICIALHYLSDGRLSSRRRMFRSSPSRHRSIPCLPRA